MSVRDPFAALLGHRRGRANQSALAIAVERAVSLSDDRAPVDAVFELRNRYRREGAFEGSRELVDALCDFATGAQLRGLTMESETLDLLGLQCSEADALATDGSLFDDTEPVHHVVGLRAYDHRRQPAEELVASCGAELLGAHLLRPLGDEHHPERTIAKRLCPACESAGTGARRAALAAVAMPAAWSGPARIEATESLRQWCLSQLDAGTFTNPEFWQHARTLVTCHFLDWTERRMEAADLHVLYDSAVTDETFELLDRRVPDAPLLADYGPPLRELIIAFLDSRNTGEDRGRFITGLNDLCVAAAS